MCCGSQKGNLPRCLTGITRAAEQIIVPMGGGTGALVVNDYSPDSVTSLEQVDMLHAK